MKYLAKILQVKWMGRLMESKDLPMHGKVFAAGICLITWAAGFALLGLAMLSVGNGIRAIAAVF